MTSRFLALALIAALAVGCGDSETSSSADANVGEMDEFETLAYAAGFQAAQGVKADSASFKFFEFSTFEEGFRDGLAQDSARVAYLFGYELGNRIASDTVSNLDADRFLAGFRLGLERDSSGISDAELATTVRVVTVLGGNLDVFRTRPFKALRKAMHPIVSEQMKNYGAGSDSRSRKRSRWQKAGDDPQVLTAEERKPWR